jgi:hypothetical protein
MFLVWSSVSVFVTVMFLVLVLLSAMAFEYSLAVGPVFPDCVEFAVAFWVLLSAVSALLLLVGFAQAEPAPKASAIAVAKSVFFMVVPSEVTS